ncbi:cell growth-regulating nucleolar protein [Hyla sarda]|uniref:cell growth-regulating nucleolar protein n=1 Tax=Hyla sarda TaxID=327740 RepID=UPI0024C3313D|nr:cell growth-regulating nucleolar protein [Hyla sarda]XP_056411113.1 cell growth-regulating nucleolar protein [Hyla sarda]XP_056411114.1 cell growth-regulating nucleolar protein [Hyla sarda]XP_056411115.1 cell growth-regulating nucleolar protein [Hyla sarda]
MVFFTCNACGESLKKAQVEKHISFCRNCQCLSCIDCGKDFLGDDYKTHLKCITEDEKYGGKGFEAKGFKGDAKQQQWLQRIKEAMKKPNLSNGIRNILNQISTYDNIPRKKAKFQNWIRNSIKVNDPALQDEVWDIFEDSSSNEKDNTNNNAPSNTTEPESKAESSSATEESEKKKSKRERKEERKKKNKKEKKDLSSEEQNGTKKKAKKRKMEEDEIPETGDEEATRKKKKKHQKHKGDEAFEEEEEEEEASGVKKKQNDSEGEEQEEQADENGADENVDEESGKKGKFNWKGTIKALLRQAPDNELPIKKLRKKVIAQYYVISSEQHKSEEELLATFNKKIHKNPTFRVLKERVKLVK